MNNQSLYGGYDGIRGDIFPPFIDYPIKERGGRFMIEGFKRARTIYQDHIIFADCPWTPVPIGLNLNRDRYKTGSYKIDNRGDIFPPFIDYPMPKERGEDYDRRS